MQATAWYQFDDVVVKPDVFTVEKAGRVLPLEPKSIRLLLYLVENRPRTVTKEELLQRVWEDVAVTDNALTRVVAQLRKAIGDDAKVARYIETVPTVGYRFIAEVTPARGPIAQPALAPPVRSPGRRASVVLASAIALAAGLLGGVLWQRSRNSDAPLWTGTALGGPSIASHPRISPDGQLLAFRAIVDGVSQVAVMKPDSASWTVLTHDRDPGAVASIAWSWDGSKIYYNRDHGFSTVYSIGPLGGEPRLVLDNASMPEPLPDGSLVGVRPSAQGRQQLLRFWPDSGRIELLPASVVMEDTRAVRAFPDGKEVAVLGFYGEDPGPRRLFALDLATKRARSLPVPSDQPAPRDSESPVTNNRSPETLAISRDGQTVFEQWNRDDMRLIYAFPRNGGGKGQLLLTFPFSAAPLCFDVAGDGTIYADQSTFDSTVTNMDGAGKVLVETPLPKGAWSPIPLPDNRFAFTVTRAGRHRIFVSRHGSEPHPLLNTDDPSRLPGAWLGGNRMAFLMGVGPASRLAIASLEDGHVIRRFPWDAHAVNAVSADAEGRTIYYTSNGVVWAQPVEGGNPRKVTEGYDVAVDPSGGVLYVMRADGPGYRLLRLQPEGGQPEAMPVPQGYALTAIRLSPSAVDRQQRILLTVNQAGIFFYRAALYDPVRHTLTDLPAPARTVALAPGWTPEGNLALELTRWSSTLWRYRISLKTE